MTELSDVLPLLDLQKFDLLLLRKRKQLEELPYRKEIIELAHVIEGLKSKELTLDKLHSKTADEEAHIGLELAQNKESILSIEETIRLKAGDYRLVSSLTTELEHLSELKGLLQQKQFEALRQLERIEELSVNLKTALEQKTKQYQDYKQVYETEGHSVLLEIESLEDIRKLQVKAIDPALYKRYERALLHHKGVGIAKLEDESCSVCRHQFSVSHLSQVKSEAPLSRCPHCSRLLVVEK